MNFPGECNVSSSSPYNTTVTRWPTLGASTCSYLPSSPYLRVSFGQATFEAEGVETPGPWFSRTIHYPGGMESGVTIGRGYDMGHRSASQVERELISVGIDSDDASWLASAAGLRGQHAQDFVKQYQMSSPTISLKAQQALFERVVAPNIIADISRILTKPDVERLYGKIDWRELKPEIQELLFDLRYRGDYRPEIRAVLQSAVVANDSNGLREIMAREDYWKGLGVPQRRIESRISIFNHQSKTN